MMNTTLEILAFPQKVPHDLIESQTNRVTLLRRRFSRCQLEVSIEKNGHLRGWVTAGETREVKLKGLPAYLNLKQAIQLLNQSYLKFQKEAITALPKGLGGGMKHSRPSAALGANKAEICAEKALQLVEAISDDKERRVVQKAVEELLKNEPEKKGLNLSEIQIGAESVQAIGIALQVNHTLQSLNFRWNNIGTAGAQLLGAALKVNQSLQSLDLEINRIGDDGVQALGSALQVNQSLQALSLGINRIGAIGAQALGAALQVNQSLRSLDLEWNNIGTTGAQALGAALQVNHTLQSLTLSSNQIGDAGAQAMGAALQINQSMQELKLHHNQIGAVGAQALGTALQVNQSLQSLDLASNEIGAAGAQALAVALQLNQSLWSLDLWNNGIGDAGVQVLSAALQVNQSIQLLNLGNNQIGHDGAQALETVLEVNQSLQSLNLERNQIGDDGVQALGAALEVNQSLQSLNLEENQIGNAGVQALETALQVNHTLQVLELSFNQIGDASRTAEKRINTLLQENEQITTAFQQQIEEVKSFLQSYKNDGSILFQHLPKLQKILQKWHDGSKQIIPSLEKILKQSGRPNLNDRYKAKQEGIITNLTDRLHELWLESFEKKVAALSNKYVMGKESSVERNVELGYALYDTWFTFLGSDCPNWTEDHLQSLMPFAVLLDIAESGKKDDVSELTDAYSLFERVLSFRNESKDSLFSLTNQSQKL